MKIIKLDNNTLPRARFRLIVDLLCWTGATAALVWFGFPTLGAIAGATGIVYLWRYAFPKYRLLYVMVKEADNIQQIMNEQMERRSKMTEEEIQAEDDQVMMEMFGTTDKDEINRIISEQIDAETAAGNHRSSI